MIKTLAKDVIPFISVQEKTDPNPTVVCFKPVTKREFDSYMDSLTEFRKGKIMSKASKAGEILYRKCMAPDDFAGDFTLPSGSILKREKGVFIYNAYDAINDIAVNIKDRDLAVDYLMGVVNIDWANELEAVMRGQSTLDEEEEKNSVGQ